MGVACHWLQEHTVALYKVTRDTVENRRLTVLIIIGTWTNGALKNDMYGITLYKDCFLFRGNWSTRKKTIVWAIYYTHINWSRIKYRLPATTLLTSTSCKVMTLWTTLDLWFNQSCHGWQGGSIGRASIRDRKTRGSNPIRSTRKTGESFSESKCCADSLSVYPTPSVYIHA